MHKNIVDGKDHRFFKIQKRSITRSISEVETLFERFHLTALEIQLTSFIKSQARHLCYRLKLLFMVLVGRSTYLFSFLLSGYLLLVCMSCKSSETCLGPKTKEIGKIEPKGKPKRHYVPEYYVYRRGKYEFVEGHYGLILFPKSYHKRSLRGYTLRQSPSTNRNRTRG
jgi:hypothetical protein